MPNKYQLSCYDDTTMWKGTWMINYLCGIGWIQDTTGDHLRINNIYLNSVEQTDQAILLIGLGLSQEEIQEIINGED